MPTGDRPRPRRGRPPGSVPALQAETVETLTGSDVELLGLGVMITVMERMTPDDVVVHDQGISVWVNSANDFEVVDKEGRPAPCGHQRPADSGF